MCQVDKCPGWAGRPGLLWVADRGSLISPGVAGRGVLVTVGDPRDTANPAQKWRLHPPSPLRHATCTK